MVLICDKEKTSRALNLRDRLRKRGCPCAAAAISEIRDYLPVQMFITYCDVFDEVRRNPYDNIYALVIGSGFVNTALNASRADNEDSAIQLLRTWLYEQNAILEEQRLPSGIFVRDSLFLAERFFEIHGLRVIPTETEYLIFKYLLACRSSGKCANADKIAAFCFAAPKPSSVRNTVAVQIANLNLKLESVYGGKPIHSRRNFGYYIDPIP